MKAILVLFAICTVQLAGAVEDCDRKCDPLDISFVVDNSQTVTTAGFKAAKTFINDFLKNFRISTDVSRVSVITYGKVVYTDQAINFNDYADKDALIAAINAIGYRAGTRTETGAAIDFMLDNQMSQGRRDVKRVVIVLTDGDSQEPDKTAAAAKRAHNRGLAVFAIGVGPKISVHELRAIASDNRHVIPTPSYNNLQDIMNQLRVKVCEEMPEPPCRHSPTELMFVIDSSVSVGKKDFGIGLSFVNSLLESFEINPSTIRVAAVMFGSKVYGDKAIYFNQYSSDSKAISAAISKLPWMHAGRTETGMGIDFMVDNFLPHTRQHIPKIGIVITDGESQGKYETIAAAERARASGIKMVAVGIGRARTEGGKLNIEELQNIAGPYGTVILADSYAGLEKVREEVVQETCVQAIIAHDEIHQNLSEILAGA